MRSVVLGITLFRIFVAPFIFISSVFLEYYWLSFWLFNLAALSDYFDGKIARSFKVESKLGAILDPIGDKLLVLFSILSIILITQDVYFAFVGALILGREFWVSALREYSSAQKIHTRTAVTFTAKVKTACQFVAISMYFLGAASNLALVTFLAHFIFFTAMLLAYKSAIDYSIRAFDG